MSQSPSDQGPEKNGPQPLHSFAEALKRECERLRQLAEQLQAREAAQAEMLENYPHFKCAIYALLREKFERECPPLPDGDLESIAVEDGALPLDAFIAEVEQAELVGSTLPTDREHPD